MVLDPRTGADIAIPSQSQPTAPSDIYVPATLAGKEIATLVVRGTLFQNWTSVQVRDAKLEPFSTFEFQVTEESPMPSFSAMQFIPGDPVQVFLGDQLVLNGFISERHVGLDAQNHGVKLVGVGITQDLCVSMPPLDKLGGHDGKSWSQLAVDLMAHLGIGLIKVGAVDDTPFQQIQVQPGEPIMQTLERYARMRNIVIGSDPKGSLMAFGEHAALSTGELVEGGNIMRANSVFAATELFLKYGVLGQNRGGDSGFGDPRNKQIAVRDGTSTRPRYLITLADVADDQHGVERRVDMEKLFHEGNYINANITVQGWFKDSNLSPSLWQSREYYAVFSPSLLLNGIVLGCKAAVFQQNEGGTTTTLEMVDPIHLNGNWSYRPGAVPLSQTETPSPTPTPSIPSTPTGRAAGPV